MKFVLTHLAIAVVIVASGCSDSGLKTYPVQGMVRFPDGKVLRGGSIEFECSEGEKPILATGVIGPDGTFVLGTREIADGAVAGQHRIAVYTGYQVGNGAERPGLIKKAELHPRFRSFRTSGLSEQIKPEPNQLTIEVEYASDELAAKSDGDENEP